MNPKLPIQMMKIILGIAFSFSQLAIFAECYYSDFTLQFEISTGDQKLIGYQHILSCNLDIDSIEHTAYLMKVFKAENDPGKIEVYKYRFPYYYCADGKLNCPKEEKSMIYTYFEKVTLNKKDVKEWKVLESIKVSALENISTDISLNDTLLFHKNPLKVVSCHGYLCDHLISIYSENEEVDVIIEEIEMLNQEIQQLDKELDYHNGDAWDERMWSLIDKLKFFDQLLTVSSCTD